MESFFPKDNKYCYNLKTNEAYGNADNDEEDEYMESLNGNFHCVNVIYKNTNTTATFMFTFTYSFPFDFLIKMISFRKLFNKKLIFFS